MKFNSIPHSVTSPMTTLPMRVRRVMGSVALLHVNELIIPCAMSDSATNFAAVSLDELLAAIY